MKNWDTKKHQQVLKEKKQKEQRKKDLKKWYEDRKKMCESDTSLRDQPDIKSGTTIENMNKWW